MNVSSSLNKKYQDNNKSAIFTIKDMCIDNKLNFILI